LTGHTGFKGSWLALALLQLGAEVWGYALPPEPERSLFNALELEQNPHPAISQSLHHWLGNIQDGTTLRQCIQVAQPDVVVHLAAQPLVRQSYDDPLGTWQTNVVGSLGLLESLKPLQHPCAVVMVTTDKVYENREWLYGYRETDRLGGHDPYSASKAAMELAVSSWRASFCGSAFASDTISRDRYGPCRQCHWRGRLGCRSHHSRCHACAYRWSADSHA
jgi:CDP-glucose 4,6-dehydratase